MLVSKKDYYSKVSTMYRNVDINTDLHDYAGCQMFRTSCGYERKANNAVGTIENSHLTLHIQIIDTLLAMRLYGADLIALHDEYIALKSDIVDFEKMYE